MRLSDTEILIIPGWRGSADDHWQSRWEAKLSTARKVAQKDWKTPQLADWVGRIIEEVNNAQKPAVLVGHSLGVIAIAHAAPQLPRDKIAGLFLVTPPDIERDDLIAKDMWPSVDGGFAPVPHAPLKVPALLIASRSDPYCSFERASEFATNWGADLVDAGDAGHICDDSGHGPWPEGLMRFGAFLKSLG